MFGGNLTECICAVLSGIFLLIALPPLILRKMHVGAWVPFVSALILDGYIILAEHFSDSLLVDWLGIILLILIGMAAFLFLVASLFLCFGFRHTKRSDLQGTETVIVLGARIYHDHLSSMLVGRLEAARKLLLAYPQMKCIVSGGKGHDEPRTEAEAMKDWLTSHGIDEARILCEDRSTNTKENFAFSAALLHENGLGHTVVVATDFYHQFRASLWAKRAGLISSGISGFKEPLLIPSYWLREIAGLLHMALSSRRK